MKSFCFGIILFLIFPFWGQTIVWDLSKLTTSAPSQSNKLFGMYGIGYTYTDPFTNEKISEYKCAEHPENLQISMKLEQSSEVSVSLIGLSNTTHLVLFLEPNEQCTIQILTNSTSYQKTDGDFANFKKTFQFSGKRAKFQQAFAFLETRLNLFNDGYTIGCFPQNPIPEWKENWNWNDSSYLLYKQFEKGLDLDLISLSEFVAQEKLDPFFLQNSKEKLINGWFEKALVAAQSESTEQYISRQFYAKYSKGNFSTPLTANSRQFASQLLNNWVDNSIEVRVPFSTVLTFMDSIQPRDNWEDLYQEYKLEFQNPAVNKEEYFNLHYQNDPAKYERIAVPFRKARKTSQ